MAGEDSGLDVAYLSTEFPPQVFGGLGVYVENISRELAALGNRVTVFSLGQPDLKRRESCGGVEVVREVPASMRDALEVFFSSQTLAWGDGLNLLCDLISYNQQSAARILESGQFCLCVAHDWLGLPGGLAVRGKVPLIYHVHGTEVGRSEQPNPQLVELEVRGAALADAVLTVSHAMKCELVGLGVDEDKIRVCHHGVDSQKFAPKNARPKRVEQLRRQFGIGSDDQVVLFLGRMEPVKGVRQLLEAVPAVRDRHPGAKLIMVGQGTMRDWAASEAARLGGVSLVDRFISQQEKIDLYFLADLCVFPSLYEPFGIVALEAAAMARPAVVGAAGISGLREIVENPSAPKPTGVHVNPKDPSDIAWGINMALDDSERLKRWGKNARQRASESFTWQAAAKKTLEVYEETVSSRA